MDILNQVETQLTEHDAIATEIRVRYKPIAYPFCQLSIGSLFCETESTEQVYVKISTGSAYCVSEPDGEEYSFFEVDSCYKVDAMNI